MTIKLSKKKKTSSSRVYLPENIIKALIRNGKITIKGENGLLQFSELNGTFTSSKRHGFMNVEATNIVFKTGSLSFSGVGGFKFHVVDNEIKLKDLKIEAYGVQVKGKGRINTENSIYKFNLNFTGNPKAIEEKLKLPFVLDGFSFGNILVSKKKDAPIKIVLNGKFDNPKIGGLKKKASYITVNLFRSIIRFYVKLQNTEIKGTYKDGLLSGRFLNLKLNDFLRIYDLELPVSSIGKGDFFYNGKKVKGKVKISGFKGKFSRLSGAFEYAYDVESQKLDVKSKTLSNEWVKIVLSAHLNFLSSTEEINIKGDFNKLKNLVPIIKYFTGVDYSYYAPDGEGNFNISLSGNFELPNVKLTSNLSYFILRDIYVGKGFFNFRAERYNSSGSFLFESKDFSFKGELRGNKELTYIKIYAKRFSINGVKKAFLIDADIGGIGKGDFDIKIYDENKFSFIGRASGDYLLYYGEKFVNYKGVIEYNYEKPRSTLKVREFFSNYRGGFIKADIYLTSQYKKWKKFNIRITGKELKFSKFFPSMQGTLMLRAYGSGEFKGDDLKVEFASDNFMFSKDKTVLRGNVILKLFSEKIDFSTSISSDSFLLNSAGSFDLNNELVKADINLSSKEIDFFLPWKGSKGELNLELNVSGNVKSPNYAGVLSVKGEKFVLPEFPQTIDDYEFNFYINNRKLYIRDSKSKIGGGDVKIFGEVELSKGDFKIEKINLKVNGKDITLYPMERVEGIVSGEVEIKGEGEFVISGNIFVKQGEWRREFDEPIEFTKKMELSTENKKILKKFAFNIRFYSSGNTWINNSVFKGEVEYDFKIVGNYINPIILGTFKVQKGEVILSDQSFSVTKGIVRFDNPYYIDPYLYVEAESYIKEYRVSFKITGYLSHPVPEFRSSPPLPEPEILTLIALGEAYRRVYSTETATQFSSSSFISTEISDFLKKTFLKKFKIDTVRIEPFIPSSSGEPTPRVSIGKKVTKNLLLIYAFEFSSQKNYTLYVEYHISKRVSIIGLRDTDGTFNIDIRYTRRK